jgi:P4 family phage/plasmid primase-like protien
MNPRGLPLRVNDLAGLEKCAITGAVAERAMLRRVESVDGAEIVGRNDRGDYAGVIFPNVWPGEQHIREYRLRRDRPDLEKKSDGTLKERGKYLSPPGRGNLLYFTPGTDPTWLTDASLPVLITEGEKKCLALTGLMWQVDGAAARPRWLPVALTGVWNWRGTIGKAPGPNGDRRDVKGVVSDFDRITWRARHVVIVFDTNVLTNDSVAAARRELARELTRRGAIVKLIDLPEVDGVNGIDDLIGVWGSERVLALIDAAQLFDNARDETNVKEIADEITASASFAKDAGGKLYVFEKGVYKPTGEQFILSRVKELLLEWRLAHGWTSRKGKEVVEYIRVDAPQLWEEPPRDILNVLNGLLNVKTKTLDPHSPDHFSSIQLPVPYDPAARCPAWDEFISQVFPADADSIPWEIPAWLMTPDTSIQKAVLLTGEGSNGKSTYLRGIIAFIGKQNTAAISLHKLEGDKYAAARLVGKLANVCPDLPSAHLSSTSMFKALTGGDVLNAEYKYRDSFEYVPFAKLVFSANQPPHSDDPTHGFFRRWQVVPFNRTFEENAEGTIPREELDARLSQPGELSGLLNTALNVLAKIRSSGFTQSDSMIRAWSEFRRATDPLSVWLDTSTVEDPDRIVIKNELYSAYNATRAAAGLPTITSTAFGLALKRIRKCIGEAQRTVDGKVQWVYTGIRFEATEVK